MTQVQTKIVYKAFQRMLSVDRTFGSATYFVPSGGMVQLGWNVVARVTWISQSSRISVCVRENIVGA